MSTFSECVCGRIGKTENGFFVNGVYYGSKCIHKVKTQEEIDLMIHEKNLIWMQQHWIPWSK